MSSNQPAPTHYVAPLEETPLVAVDAVNVGERKSNLWIDAWRDMRRRPMFWISAVIIVLMVVLSLTLGLVQERRSGRAAAALRAMVHTTASVLRPDQAPLECPIEQLVPGDVLHLSAGDLVPADVRVLAARDFFVNEAALTGESVPAEKHGLTETPEAIAQGDALALRNTCFMGTNVASGSATAVVVHTGARAVFGGIAQALTGDRVQTSFEQGIDKFTWLMLRFMAVMVPLVFLINGLSKGDWLEALLFATAVAVGLTPEMLPMLVTVNLAKGALTMSRKKVIVKRLDAIQNIGAMDVLCTDKTGTLTQDHIILEKYVDLRGEPSDRVLDFAYLNSHYQSGLKNLLDVAVLKYAEVHDKLHAQGLYQKVDEIPFDFQRRRMSVVLARGEERLLICKGAVEEVFAACRWAEVDGERIPLDASHLAEVQAASRVLNEDGFRVIAIAHKPLPVEAHALTVADESDLILLGYIAFLDPPKESAKPALAALAAHGVAVKILTGDNEVVTRKVCRDVGLDATHVLLGRDIEAMNDVALAHAVERTQVFALAGAEGARHRGAACARPRGGLHGRWHQRRAGFEGGGRGHLGGHGGGHRERVGRHHPAGEKPAGAGRGRHRGPQGVRQFAQVHPHGRELQLWQHVQRAGGQRVVAFPADGAHPGAEQQPALRPVADGHPDRHGGR